MRGRIAFLLIVLFLSVYACAQEGTVEHGWTDKNNTEMYAAYMLQGAYYEQGYLGAKVEIRQAGTKRVFVVQPGRIYHVGRFDLSGLGDLPEEAMTDSPKAGDVYSPDRVNEWLRRRLSKDARATFKAAQTAGPGMGCRGRRASVSELLAQDTFVETVAGIEQHPHRNGLVRQNLDAADVARLVVVGDRGHRALVTFKHFDDDEGGIGKQRAAPAPRPERTDRRQREQGGIDRQDRSLR